MTCGRSPQRSTNTGTSTEQSPGRLLIIPSLGTEPCTIRSVPVVMESMMPAPYSWEDFSPSLRTCLRNSATRIFGSAWAEQLW